MENVLTSPEHLIKIDGGSLLVHDAAMALGKRGDEQEDLFVTHQQLRAQSHPYYRAMNKVLAEAGFDRYAETLCARFYGQEDGASQPTSRRVLQVLAVGLLRGHRQRAWYRLARGRAL